jgi:hypothetical protein
MCLASIPQVKTAAFFLTRGVFATIVVPGATSTNALGSPKLARMARRRLACQAEALRLITRGWDRRSVGAAAGQPSAVIVKRRAGDEAGIRVHSRTEAVHHSPSPVRGATRPPTRARQWERLVTPVETITPDRPELYTLRFDRTGRVAVRADCNRGGGTGHFAGVAVGVRNVIISSAAPRS